MGVVQQLSLLALRQSVEGACQAVGVSAGERSVETVVNFLDKHFTDHSLALTAAMRRAGDRAWKALEIALAGEKIWNWLDSADHKAFRQQVRAACAFKEVHLHVDRAHDAIVRQDAGSDC